MKSFKKLVGLLLCLAMALSIVPASVVGAAELGAETEQVMQKIDLTGTVAGICSSPYSSSVSYANQNWYSSQNVDWRDLSILVDGNLTNELHFGVSDGERADLYLDLTKKNGSAISADQFKLYYGGYESCAINSVTVVLDLADGTQVTKQFATNWGASNADPLAWTFDQTYELNGIYVWADSVLYGGQNTLTLAEVELYQLESSTTEPTTPATEPTTPATEPTTPATEPTTPATQPTEPVAGTQSALTGLATPTFGYYTDNNTDGAITDHYNESYAPANLVNGSYDDQTRSLYYLYDDVDTGAKIPVILFDLGTEKNISAVEVATYKATYYSIDDFTIQVYTDSGWVTVKEVTGAFSSATHGEACDPEKYEFTATTGTKLRILVTKIPDMSAYSTEDADSAELATGSYIRLTEATLYETVGGSTTEPTTPPVTEPTTPTTEDTTPATEPTETPTAPTVPSDPIKQGNILQIVPASKITTQFGYYADYTGDDETTFVDCNDGYCVTDGWFGRAGYSECTSKDGLIGLIMTLDESVALGAIEVIGQNEENNAACLDVQVWIDGQWVSVASRTSNIFVSGMDQMIDFRQTVTTNKVRILVYAVAVAENECYFNEVVLYESTTGNVSQIIDLTGKGDSTDAEPDHPLANLADGDKKTEFLGSIATFDLTVDGQATAVDGFNLYAHRADDTVEVPRPFPAVVDVQIEKILGGGYESIGTFETGWSIDGITDVLTAKFDQTYMAYSIRFTFDKWGYVNELELLQNVRETEPTEPETILVGATYNIHLIEPWALRTTIKFARNNQDNLIPVSEFTSYGVYAIIGNKFEGDTAEELIADPDVVKYTNVLENIKPASETTLTFDFYDGLYSFNLDESIYWVAYFETAEGVHYTGMQDKSLIEVADALLEDSDVPASEKAILNSMKEMKDCMTALRGASADLGHTYPAGVANPGTLGERNTGYAFGSSYQIKLIEPWGIRVRVLMRDKEAAAYADYENADDYGLIFFHDKTGKYGGTMTPEQMKAETEAKLYSKQNDNAWINGKGASAIYDHEIYTHELDTELYCLPYIVIDGEYYYPSTVSCWNLLDEMVEFSKNEELVDEEIAAFQAILKMYENVQNHMN